PPLPVWLVPASWAVCLLNPHHFHVFALPAELSPMLSAVGLPQDARFQGLFAPAWRLNLRGWPGGARHPAGWSFGLPLCARFGFFRSELAAPPRRAPAGVARLRWAKCLAGADGAVLRRRRRPDHRSRTSELPGPSPGDAAGSP